MNSKKTDTSSEAAVMFFAYHGMLKSIEFESKSKFTSEIRKQLI